MFPLQLNILNDQISIIYYPDVTQTHNYPTSFTYQIIDNEGYQLTAGDATMYIQATIPVAHITVNSPLTKSINYDLNESDNDAAKYFTYNDLIDGYNNTNNSSVDHIKIYGTPSRGELSYDGFPVNINDTIPYVDLVTGHFAYYPQNIDRGDSTGGSFSTSFTYSVLDLQGATESNLVTFNLDCNDVTSNISILPPVLRYNGVDYVNQNLGNTASSFTLTGVGTFTISFKNTTTNNILFYGGPTSSSIHLFGNTSIIPTITVSPQDNDLLASGLSTPLTFNRNSIPNGKYLVSVATKYPYLSGYLTSAYIWYITLA
jgi:hypothetical protein